MMTVNKQPVQSRDAKEHERILREAVLDTALWHFVGFHPGDDPEVRERGLAELCKEGLPQMFRLRSQVEEVESAIYGTLLVVVLDGGLVDEAVVEATKAFLDIFHQAIDHRKRTRTWEQDGQWFAAPVGEDEAGAKVGASEQEALRKLYEQRPDLRQG